MKEHAGKVSCVELSFTEALCATWHKVDTEVTGVIHCQMNKSTVLTSTLLTSKVTVFKDDISAIEYSRHTKYCYSGSTGGQLSW